MALLSSPITQAADHADALMTATSPMADLGDVYAWNTSDASKVNLALTVSPFDDGTRAFGPAVQYVFHLTRYAPILSNADFPITPQQVAVGEESRVVCTFTSNTAGKCWVIDPAKKVIDYVEGDFSGATGKVSESGKVRVFAGRRSDPFFFNFAGFATAQKLVEGACDNPGTQAPEACPGVLANIDDDAGCPAGLTAAQTGPIALQLSAQQNGQGISVLPPGCSSTVKDCFADKKVMALVVQIDKTLVVTTEKPIVSVYASTHAGQ